MNETSVADILLVIPAYCESRRLPAFLGPLLQALREVDPGGRVRVRVVDDGSPEAECEATRLHCESLATEFPVLEPLFRLPANLGKGGAVYAGWADAGGAKWLGFCDADGSVGPDEIVRLIRILSSTDFRADALVASRRVTGGRRVTRSFFREGLSRIFSWWVRRTLGLSVHDPQCGCKFVRREAFARVRPDLAELRFAFDTELLLRLVRSDATIREESVDWTARAGGSLCVARDGVRMVRAVRRMS